MGMRNSGRVGSIYTGNSSAISDYRSDYLRNHSELIGKSTAGIRRIRRLRTNMIILISLTVVFLLIIGMLFFTAYAKENGMETADNKYYVQIMVERGDSLWSIAREYMTDDYDDIYDYINEIKRLNHISGDIIKEGYTLTIAVHGR